mgnify:CR=1 FL=1
MTEILEGLNVFCALEAWGAVLTFAAGEPAACLAAS